MEGALIAFLHLAFKRGSESDFSLLPSFLLAYAFLQHTLSLAHPHASKKVQFTLGKSNPHKVSIGGRSATSSVATNVVVFSTGWGRRI